MSASVSKPAPAVIGLLACVVIAGCTDPQPIEPPQPSPASQEEFASEMRSLCGPVMEARARLLRSRSQEQLRERSSQLLAEQETIAGETRDVTPPAGASDAVSRYADVLAAAVENGAVRPQWNVRRNHPARAGVGQRTGSTRSLPGERRSAAARRVSALRRCRAGGFPGGS